MAWIFVDKGSEGNEEMRSQMRRNMRGESHLGGYSPVVRGGSYEHGYRMGYRHGWEDSEREEIDGVEMRRARDSRGRFM